MASTSTSAGLKKLVNEDTSWSGPLMIQDQSGDSKVVHMHCIFDGHGGSDCSKYLQSNWNIEVQKRLLDGLAVEQSIKAAVAQVESNCLANIQQKVFSSRSGSTLLSVLLLPDNSNTKGKLVVANVGDSRAIKVSNNGRKIVRMSTDHTPALEKDRIEKAGGFA